MTTRFSYRFSYRLSINTNRPLWLIWLSLFSIASTGQTFATDLIIQNTTLVSPERSAPLQHASVLIRDGKIEAISETPFVPKESTQVLDGSDLYLTPGLMDSHLHTLVLPGLGFQGGQRSKKYSEMTELYEQQFERSLLYFGVTQVLDPAAHPAALAKSLSRELSPDIFHCGAAPLANGYPTISMGKRTINYTLPYRIYEESPNDTNHHIDLSQHTPEAVVKRMRDDGAICLKLFFEDGWGLKNDWPMLSDDSIKRVISAARASNLKVIGHANAIDMQQLAVKAGVDVLGHGLWNWNQYRKHEGMPEEIRLHLENVHAKGIGYQPTLRVMDSMRALFKADYFDNPALKKVIPAKLLDWYQTPTAHAFKRELEQEDFKQLSDEKIVTIMSNPISRGERSVRYLSELGHDLLLASDHPATPGHANHPGLSTYQEMVHMAALGIPLRKVFEAATINNAKMFNLADRYGSIEPGKKANLLLLASNPLETIEAYDQIRWVVLGGRVIDRDSLAADRLKQ